MKTIKSVRAWWRGLFRKRRFNMLNATDNSEEWHVHVSPASLLAGLVAFVLVLFILTLSLVAYSPVLEFLPGYRTEAVSYTHLPVTNTSAERHGRATRRRASKSTTRNISQRRTAS